MRSSTGPGKRSGEIQYTAAKMMTINFLSLSFFDIRRSLFLKNYVAHMVDTSFYLSIIVAVFIL